jgi:hypothetical protein
MARFSSIGNTTSLGIVPGRRVRVQLPTVLLTTETFYLQFGNPVGFDSFLIGFDIDSSGSLHVIDQSVVDRYNYETYQVVRYSKWTATGEFVFSKLISTNRIVRAGSAWIYNDKIYSGATIVATGAGSYTGGQNPPSFLSVDMTTHVYDIVTAVDIRDSGGATTAGQNGGPSSTTFDYNTNRLYLCCATEYINGASQSAGLFLFNTDGTLHSSSVVTFGSNNNNWNKLEMNSAGTVVRALGTNQISSGVVSTIVAGVTPGTATFTSWKFKLDYSATSNDSYNTEPDIAVDYAGNTYVVDRIYDTSNSFDFKYNAVIVTKLTNDSTPTVTAFALGVTDLVAGETNHNFSRPLIAMDNTAQGLHYYVMSYLFAGNSNSVNGLMIWKFTLSGGLVWKRKIQRDPLNSISRFDPSDAKISPVNGDLYISGTFNNNDSALPGAVNPLPGQTIFSDRFLFRMSADGAIADGTVYGNFFKVVDDTYSDIFTSVNVVATPWTFTDRTVTVNTPVNITSSLAVTGYDEVTIGAVISKYNQPRTIVYNTPGYTFWACAADGLYVTEVSGELWNKFTTTASPPATPSLCYQLPQIGNFLIAANNKVYHTGNYGATWSEMQYLGASVAATEIMYSGFGYSYAITNSSKVYKSDNSFSSYSTEYDLGWTPSALRNINFDQVLFMYNGAAPMKGGVLASGSYQDTPQIYPSSILSSTDEVYFSPSQNPSTWGYVQRFNKNTMTWSDVGQLMPATWNPKGAIGLYYNYTVMIGIETGLSNISTVYKLLGDNTATLMATLTNFNVDKLYENSGNFLATGTDNTGTAKTMTSSDGGVTWEIKAMTGYPTGAPITYRRSQFAYY